MKGLYILGVLVLLLASLLYFALKETHTDLTRQYGFLRTTVEEMEAQLKKVMEPLKRLRSEKYTIRLDKDFNRLRGRVQAADKRLDAALHSIEHIDDLTRDVTSRSLASMRQEMDVLLVDITTFTSRVRTIHDYVVTSIPLSEKINGLMQACQSRVAARERTGAPYSPEQLDKVEKVIENSQKILKQSRETLNWIWQDLEQGRTYADRMTGDMQKCIPSLETLLKDLEEG